MPLKYQCPKCERRYVEWGAQKFNFKCPHCVNEELVRLGAVEQTSSRSSSLKRRPRKVAAQPVPTEEVDLAEMEPLEPAEDADEEELDEEPEVVVGVGASVEPVVEEDTAEVEIAAETIDGADEEIDLVGDIEEGGDDEIAEELDLEER